MKRKRLKKNILTGSLKSNWLERVSFPLIYKSLSVAALLSLTTWLYLFMSDVEQFPVNRVQIVGDYSHIDKGILKKAVMPHVLNGFFNTNLEDIKSEVKQVPWVDDVAVSREWPDKVTIKLLEQQPLCAWNENALLSIRHEIFYPPQKTMPVGLPRLKGPEGLHSKVLDTYFTMKKLLEPLGLSIAEIELDKRHSWQLRLTNGMKLIVGRNNTQERVEQFASIYRKVFESKENAVHYVDLRYKHGMAVGWKT